MSFFERRDASSPPSAPHSLTPTPLSHDPRVWIEKLVLSDNSEIPISKDDVLVFVGPNNAGKTALLRGIKDKLERSSRANPVLKKIAIGRSGNDSDVKAWLEGIAKRYKTPDYPEAFHHSGHTIDIEAVSKEWSSPSALGDLAPFFCEFLAAEGRLTICHPSERMAPERRNLPRYLIRDDELENRLSSWFYRAFGVDLIVNRNSDEAVPIHVGGRPTLGPGEDRVSLSYARRIEELPLLYQQGDGMRSFAGVLLATSAGDPRILLIDEPEAFLYPSHARTLGSALVADKAKKSQLFIATHSCDVLRGVLDSNSEDVRVLRLTRSATGNSVRLLDNSRIKDLWSDPLLRSSHILDGLFHEGVVVCEADGDSRFYESVVDALYSVEVDENSKRPDLMFTHCGGKARLPLVVKALREVGVPVCAIADFDILSSEQPLKDLVEALGLDWSDISTDWKTINISLTTARPELSTSQVKDSINRILSETHDSPFPTAKKKDIENVLKRSSPWLAPKQAGKSCIPSGDASKACERLLAKLSGSGLHVVEVGELEGFVRTIGGEGPRWVREVLQRDLVQDPELDQARQFVRKVLSFFSS